MSKVGKEREAKSDVRRGGERSKVKGWSVKRMGEQIKESPLSTMARYWKIIPMIHGDQAA